MNDNSGNASPQMEKSRIKPSSSQQQQQQQQQQLAVSTGASAGATSSSTVSIAASPPKPKSQRLLRHRSAAPSAASASGASKLLSTQQSQDAHLSGAAAPHSSLQGGSSGTPHAPAALLLQHALLNSNSSTAGASNQTAAVPVLASYLQPTLSSANPVRRLASHASAAQQSQSNAGTGGGTGSLAQQQAQHAETAAALRETTAALNDLNSYVEALKTTLFRQSQEREAAVAERNTHWLAVLEQTETKHQIALQEAIQEAKTAQRLECEHQFAQRQLAMQQQAEQQAATAMQQRMSMQQLTVPPQTQQRGGGHMTVRGATLSVPSNRLLPSGVSAYEQSASGNASPRGSSATQSNNNHQAVVSTSASTASNRAMVQQHHTTSEEQQFVIDNLRRENLQLKEQMHQLQNLHNNALVTLTAQSRLLHHASVQKGHHARLLRRYHLRLQLQRHYALVLKRLSAKLFILRFKIRRCVVQCFDAMQRQLARMHAAEQAHHASSQLQLVGTSPSDSGGGGINASSSNAYQMATVARRSSIVQPHAIKVVHNTSSSGMQILPQDEIEVWLKHIQRLLLLPTPKDLNRLNQHQSVSLSSSVASTTGSMSQNGTTNSGGGMSAYHASLLSLTPARVILESNANPHAQRKKKTQLASLSCDLLLMSLQDLVLSLITNSFNLHRRCESYCATSKSLFLRNQECVGEMLRMRRDAQTARQEQEVWRVTCAEYERTVVTLIEQIHMLKQHQLSGVTGASGNSLTPGHVMTRRASTANTQQQRMNRQANNKNNNSDSGGEESSLFAEGAQQSYEELIHKHLSALSPVEQQQQQQWVEEKQHHKQQQPQQQQRASTAASATSSHSTTAAVEQRSDASAKRPGSRLPLTVGKSATHQLPQPQPQSHAPPARHQSQHLKTAKSQLLSEPHVTMTQGQVFDYPSHSTRGTVLFVPENASALPSLLPRVVPAASASSDGGRPMRIEDYRYSALSEDDSESRSRTARSARIPHAQNRFTLLTPR